MTTPYSAPYRGQHRGESAQASAVLILLIVLAVFPTGAGADPPVTLLYTDWTVVPGRVFYQGAAAEQTLAQAASGRLYSVNVGPDGVLYLADANRFEVLRWSGAAPEVIYTHTTYVRDIAFDPQGRLYFSEATGAAGNGRIYRLDDSGATLFFTVSLPAVGGFWAGHFAFAPDGTLYLSSGNIVGASIYRVLGGTPVVFYTDASASIAGFDFDAAGNLYYADWFHHVYQVTPAAVRTVVLDVPGRRFADVAVARRSIALGPEHGRVNSVAPHPTNADILYAGSASGGVFRTSSAAQGWFLRSRGMSDPSVDGVLVHPTSPATVFAVTSSGVFRSTDEGLSWTQPLALAPPLPPPDLPEVFAGFQKKPIRYDPLDGSIYAAPFCAGVYRSSDGTVWTQVYPLGPAGSLEMCVTSIDVSPADGGTVYITMPLGIRKRVGGAGAWLPIGTEIDNAPPLVLRVAPSDPNRLYVAATNSLSWPPNTNVWVRPDAASSFVRTTTTPPWPSWFFGMSLAVHPTSPLTVYLGSIYLYGTSDASHWSMVGCGVCGGGDYRGLTFDAAGTRLFPSWDQGIARLDVATNTFTALNTGLVNTQVYDVDVGVDGAVYGAMQDTGAQRKAGTASWTSLATALPGDVSSGDVLDVLAHPTNPLKLFMRTNAETVLRSDDAGMTMAAGPLVPGGGFWNHQLAYDAATTTVYVGTRNHGVYKSSSDGAGYVPANTGIETRGIRCVALQPGSATIAYAGTYADGVYKTTDGASWTPLAAFPESGALVLTVNPGATRVFAGTKTGVYVSTTGGASWSPSNTGLPSVRVVSEILVDPVCPCLVYAGLGYYHGTALYGGGIYESTDGGSSWSALTSPAEAGLSVTSIRIDPADRSRLHVATFGSGVRTLVRGLTAPGGCSC